MTQLVLDGDEATIGGQRRVYYDGYWIKAYDVPADTLLAKKQLIEALTRRLFNHVEHGINVPGTRLDEAHRAFDTETDVQRKRVKGAMLAGALFNRATDVFRKLVELQACGVSIQADSALMCECGRYLEAALTLGRMVRHCSGEEGIDELWGEPFKAFAYPIEEFYKSRYIKIAQAMRAIDAIARALGETFNGLFMFDGVAPLIADFAVAARAKSETLRTESDVFEVWTSFVVAGERLTAFEPLLSREPTPLERLRAAQGVALVRNGKELVSWIARARVPMPKNTGEFIDLCVHYREQFDTAPFGLRLDVACSGELSPFGAGANV
jgi:hypothetical protein